jgi:hypothetical protein
MFPVIQQARRRPMHISAGADEKQDNEEERLEVEERRLGRG